MGKGERTSPITIRCHENQSRSGQTQDFRSRSKEDRCGTKSAVGKVEDAAEEGCLEPKEPAAKSMGFILTVQAARRS